LWDAGAPAVSDPESSLWALMEQVVAAGTERRLAHLRLLDDPFSHRLKEGIEQEAIDFALAAGQAAAEWITGKWGKAPEEIAAALRVPVTRSDEPAQAGPSVLFSEYRARPPSIILYARSLEETNGLIRAHGLEELLGLADVTPVHLAHELYHHLEGKKLTPGTAGFRIETARLGPLHFRTGLPSLSEIAADRFATALLGLRVPPKTVEFVTLFHLNPDYAWRSLARLQTLPA